MRSLALVREGIELGATRVVIGTAAALDPTLVPAAVAMAPDRIAVGIDTRDGMVAVRGWVETTALSAMDLARRVTADGVAVLVHTDVARDGMLGGPDVEGASALQQMGARVIASGGIGTLDDLRAVRDAGLAGAIVGRALYDGRFTLSEALGTL
jgi:phosphoribosylformimino-5-aminoimidazole carboxamide ribotide isomerase